MALITKETIKIERISKRKNFINQAKSKVLSGRWAEFTSSLDGARSRTNVLTSRLLMVRDSVELGIASLPLKIFYTFKSLPKEKVERTDCEIYREMMEEPSDSSFLKRLFGTPEEVLSKEKIEDKGEHYLYLSVYGASDENIKDFIEKRLTTLTFADILSISQMTNWYKNELVEDHIQTYIMNSSMSGEKASFASFSQLITLQENMTEEQQIDMFDSLKNAISKNNYLSANFEREHIEVFSEIKDYIYDDIPYSEVPEDQRFHVLNNLYSTFFSMSSVVLNVNPIV